MNWLPFWQGAAGRRRPASGSRDIAMMLIRWLAARRAKTLPAGQISRHGD
jgi:hypothetical protein